jgi:2-oxoglutarate ferredoxin oxidoreductase subunit alpha
MEAREQNGLDLGYVRLKTLWPFPEENLREVIKAADNIFIPEMNFGMMKHPIVEALRDRCQNFISIPSIGILHSPEHILSKIIEETK